MSRTSMFGPSELSLVAQALEVAEESVSDYYQLSEAAWLRYPYDLKTRAQLRPQEVESEALAQVLRLSRPARGGRLRPRDLYRICLQDPNLLNLVRREGAEELMQPLLIYVLAHELVHVVRFCSFQHLFQADDGQREREEATVHGITAQCLARVRLPHLERVLDFYEEHGGDRWAAA
jgi:hypothetical protein